MITKHCHPGARASLSILAILTLLIGCSLVWPPPSSGADVEFAWALPDTTVIGIDITPAYIAQSHFVFTDGQSSNTAVSDSTFVYQAGVDGWPVNADLEGRVCGYMRVMDLDARKYWTFAVACTDTFGRAGPLSDWTEPWRPADSNPGPAAAPAIISVNLIKVW